MAVHVDCPEPPVMVVGLQLTVRPVDGLTEVERLTVPVKPFWPVMVTVKVPLALPDNGRATKL